jgi:hypothetical protein
VFHILQLLNIKLRLQQETDVVLEQMQMFLYKYMEPKRKHKRSNSTTQRIILKEDRRMYLALSTRIWEKLRSLELVMTILVLVLDGIVIFLNLDINCKKVLGQDCYY